MSDYHLYLEFADGTQKTIDFLPFIKEGASKELLDKEIFSTARVDYGTVVWGNGYDVCPVFLKNL